MRTGSAGAMGRASYLAGAVRVTTPAPRDVWRELLERDPAALVSQTPEWLDCMTEAGGYRDVSRLYELPGGRMVVLPLAGRRGLRGPLAIESSFPEAWGIGGVVSNGPLQAQDVRAVLQDLRRRLTLRTSIRPNPLAADAWKAGCPPGVLSIPRAAHVLDLSGGFQEVRDKRFTNEARRNLRKAESFDLKVECDTTGKLVPVFYQLFGQSVDRWAGQHNEARLLARWRAGRRDPIRKFEVMARRLSAACRIWVAWHKGEPAAAIMVLQGANAHYTRGAMNREVAGPTRASFLLHRLAIEDACRAGCKHYHMGETRPESSLARFKEHFGATLHAYATFRVERVPATRVEDAVRGLAKRTIRFKDA